MMFKLLPVGLMVCGVAFATQTASAQGGGWNGGCQSNAPTGPEPSNWHGPTSYQPGPGQNTMAPPPTAGHKSSHDSAIPSGSDEQSIDAAATGGAE